jgi:hypothetical protein
MCKPYAASDYCRYERSEIRYMKVDIEVEWIEYNGNVKDSIILHHSTLEVSQAS